MKTWILAAAMMAAPALALGQALPTKEPAKKEAAKKSAAQGEAIAKVNGVAVPRARQDIVVQQQSARGMPDNPQTRAMVREELINREVVAQEAQRSGVAKSPEVQTQMDMARQAVLVRALFENEVKSHPVSDADLEKQYEAFKSSMGTNE